MEAPFYRMFEMASERNYLLSDLLLRRRTGDFKTIGKEVGEGQLHNILREKKIDIEAEAGKIVLLTFPACQNGRNL